MNSHKHSSTFFSGLSLSSQSFLSVRWAKGGVVIQGARESVFVTKADHSFFTEPVSCQVFNAVGSTNVSILVDVHCKEQLIKSNLFLYRYSYIFIVTHDLYIFYILSPFLILSGWNAI